MHKKAAINNKILLK